MVLGKSYAYHKRWEEAVGNFDGPSICFNIIHFLFFRRLHSNSWQSDGELKGVQRGNGSCLCLLSLFFPYSIQISLLKYTKK